MGVLVACDLFCVWFALWFLLVDAVDLWVGVWWFAGFRFWLVSGDMIVLGYCLLVFSGY